MAPPGKRTLSLHVDGHDVAVLQMAGARKWTLCAPPRQARGVFPNGDLMPPPVSELAALEAAVHELDAAAGTKAPFQGRSVALAELERSSMECANRTLHADETLTVKRGVVVRSALPPSRSRSTAPPCPHSPPPPP